MAKSRKEILQELLDLENSKVEDIEEKEGLVSGPESTPIETIEAVEKPKKPGTQKQIEAFERAKGIRDANALKRKEEADRIALELKKKAEEKIVKKAIAIKKKEIKKQAVLDEVSDDDTPIEKVKQIASKVAEEIKPIGPRIIFF